MLDLIADFKELGLHGMASAWPEVQGTARIKSLDHETVLMQLIKAEKAQREVRSMAYQMRVARFPAHRDLLGFDFTQAHVDEALVQKLHSLEFVNSAHNVARAKPTWPPVWASKRSVLMASGFDSSPRWNWSTLWSWRKRKTKPVNWPIG